MCSRRFTSTLYQEAYAPSNPQNVQVEPWRFDVAGSRATAVAQTRLESGLAMSEREKRAKSGAS